MDEQTSGQQANDDVVTMTKAEHDRLTARVRLAEKADKDSKVKAAKERAEAEKKELEKRLKAAEDAGIGKELRETEAERDALRNKLQRVLTENTIRDAASGRQWSVSAQRAAVKMVDSSKLERDEDGVPTEDSIKDALDGLVEEYPDIYVSAGQTGEGVKSGNKKKAVKTPANPAVTEKKAHFEGFISPDEYVETPFDVRQSDEFRARLEKSRQYWPTTFNHKELGASE